MANSEESVPERRRPQAAVRRALSGVTINHPGASWLKRFTPGEGKIYLGILRALEDAIREGELQVGDQIPPQRTVASMLGVDFTTVTRAYSAARARGLIEGSVGRGTFVTGPLPADDVGLVDLALDAPPQPQGLLMAQVLRETTRAILERTDVATLMAYHQGAGSLGQRVAAATWLEPCLGEVTPERILVSAGGEVALSALLSTLFKPGDALVVEPLTYRGFLVLARHFQLRLIPCPVDDEGFVPERLAQICATESPSALYCIPTLQTATTATMGIERRREVARICRQANLLIIEDDAFGRVPQESLPAIAVFAPERTYYVSTLSKALSPGLRHAFIAAPDAESAQRILLVLRYLSIMPTPLLSAVVTTWIREGMAEQLLQAIRRETRERRALAGSILPNTHGGADSPHVWLDLPQTANTARLRTLAREKGLSMLTAEMYATTTAYRHGMRISLGAPVKQSLLVEGLQALAPVLREEMAGERRVELKPA